MAMDNAAYEKALENAVEEFFELMAQQGEVETRMAQLKLTIKGLSSLMKPGSELAKFASEFISDLESQGITEHCRQILIASNSRLTALELRDRLTAVFPEYKHSPNVLASIHTILKRFVKANQAKSFSSAASPTAYQWIRRFPREKSKVRETHGEINSAVGQATDSSPKILLNTNRAIKLED